MIYNKTLVRLVDYYTDNFIHAYWTENAADALKMYSFMLNNDDIKLEIGESEEHPSEFDGYLVHVKDISVTFGNESTLNCINVYVNAGSREDD